MPTNFVLIRLILKTELIQQTVVKTIKSVQSRRSFCIYLKSNPRWIRLTKLFGGLRFSLNTKLLRLASYYKQLYIYFENEKSKRLLASFGNTRFFGSLRPSCLDFTFEKKYIIAEETKLIKNYKK